MVTPQYLATIRNLNGRITPDHYFFHLGQVIYLVKFWLVTFADTHLPPGF